MPDTTRSIPPDQHTIQRLSYNYARRQGVLLRRDNDGNPECLHRPGISLTTITEISRIAGPGIILREVTDAKFENALGQAYRDSATEAAESAATADDNLASLADNAAAVDDLLDQRDDAPIVRLINALMLEAIKEKASDIHIEVQEKRLIIRFRIDGVLRDMLEPKRSLAPLLVSRIKVMAKLDIAEKRSPQDGRVSLRVGGHEVDVRVSTIPTQYGERVVMRLLERNQAGLDLNTIGMCERDLTVFRRLLRRPHGIMLVTGPTGSGKTTTLYGAIRQLNDRKRNIMTVEDPIEYAVDGTAQTQVNHRTGMTFAKGLRAILRQDPDIIMVGEIRDSETAQTAVQSAMTGHFVLSTLHTNTAIGSVTRLLDMGVERFLLAPMLTGVVAQRLVRRLCDHCKREETATVIDRNVLGNGIEKGKTVYRPVGCDHCFNEGYRGRTGVYEVVEIDETMQTMIHDGASEADLVRTARKNGPSLLQDGIEKVLAGLTSVEEVARVVQEEHD